MSFRSALNTLIKSGYNRGIKSETTSALKPASGLKDPFDRANEVAVQDKIGLEIMKKNAAKIAENERLGTPINPEGGNIRS